MILGIMFFRDTMCPGAIVGFLILFLGTLTTLVQSKTNSEDASALNVMFTSLNSPSELTNWKSSGGDPCSDSWKGITCSGSAVTEINLSGLGLTGSMGYQLSNLKSVTYFDLSKNNLNNDIPYQLPPSTAHLDLSSNGFSGSIPYSISQMANLQYLDLSHNDINGQLSDMFQQLKKLKTLDLSENSLSGNLPQSFSSLSSLEKMNLKDNKFTGSINVLARLPLEKLNVENNKFTGWIPSDLKGISQTGGNSWSSGPAPPPPPGTKPSPERGKGSKGESKSNKVGEKHALKWIIIVASVLAALLVIGLLVTLLSTRRRRREFSTSSNYLDEETGNSQRRGFTPLASEELSKDTVIAISNDLKETKSIDSSNVVDTKTLQKSPSAGFKPNDNEFASRLNAQRSTSMRPILHSLSELQTATGNFAPGRLLGQGSLGCVYRAKYPNGKVLAVKTLDPSILQPEDFSEIVLSISRVRHQNIAELVGYCSEQGHSLLIYEYYRNGSLHDFLHMSDDYSHPLTWNTRVRIALGTARAVEYLHEVCSPSFIHKNIKSSNILLDLELNPHLCDYGLSNFHHSTSQNLGVGYNAPECTMPSAYTMKSDIYSFGVVMLELLTGRMPYDSSRPKSEQCLVRWATPQLHDIAALAKMVDPALRGLYPPKSLSRFADIIALCVQTEPEFRPPMSEVVQALVRLVQRSSMNMRDDLAASRHTDDSDY